MSEFTDDVMYISKTLWEILMSKVCYVFGHVWGGYTVIRKSTGLHTRECKRCKDYEYQTRNYTVSEESENMLGDAIMSSRNGCEEDRS